MYMIPRNTTPRPMVTMMTEMTGSPINGRRITRSTATPRTKAQTRVTRKAT